MLFAALFGHVGLGMELLQSLIAAINQDFGFRVKPNFRFLEKPKVVPSSFIMGNTQNATRRFLDNKLGFQRVSLLLSRIIAPLSFFGRSMGVSVASSRITSNCRSLATTALRPGSPNTLLLASVFSHHVMIR